MNRDESSDSVNPSDKFDQIGQAPRITEDDLLYYIADPGADDHIRPVTPEDVEAPPETTHVRVFADVDFNGQRSGRRHRAFLRRIERQP